MTDPLTKRSCFFISPIGADDSPEREASDKVLKHLIRKAIGTRYDIRRGDSDPNPGAITPSIVASIQDADLVIADLSGSNPNVFYEVAVAHGYSKPTIHIQRATEHVAFDVKDMRIVRYNLGDPDDLEVAQKKLRENAEFLEANPTKAETPLSSADRFAQVTASVDPVAESNVRVFEAIDEIRADLRRMARGTSAAEVTAPGSPPTDEADARSLKKIVERVHHRGSLISSDVVETITTRTSQEFDDWMRELLSEIDFGRDSDDLLSSEMRAAWPSGDTPF